MRISDWSSDVCSSDLPAQCEQQHAPPPEMVGEIAEDGRGEKGRDRHDEADPRADLDRVRQVEFADLHHQLRSEEHTSELQSLMRISYAVFCLKKKKQRKNRKNQHRHEVPNHYNKSEKSQ